MNKSGNFELNAILNDMANFIKNKHIIKFSEVASHLMSSSDGHRSVDETLKEIWSLRDPFINVKVYM